MPLLQIMRSRGLWIGLGAAALTVILMSALGALAVVKGLLPPGSQAGWIWGSYVAAGLVGTWIAARGRKGTLLRAVILCVLVVVIAWVISLAVSNGMDLSDGGWKITLSVLVGCMVGGLLRAGSGKRRRSRGPAKKPGRHRKIR